jgi:hypothetical protein
MGTVAITLIGKPGCHLCDQARDAVTSVVADLGHEASAPSITVEERSIFDDPALLAEYEEEIPVVLVDGRVHTIWRVDPTRLRTAILEAQS